MQHARFHVMAHITPAWALANPTPAHSAAVVFTAARIAAGAPLPGAPALVGAFAGSSAPGSAGDGAGASPAAADADPPKKLKSGESGSGTCSRQVYHLSRSGLQGSLKGGERVIIGRQTSVLLLAIKCQALAMR